MYGKLNGPDSTTYAMHRNKALWNGMMVLIAYILVSFVLGIFALMMNLPLFSRCCFSVAVTCSLGLCVYFVIFCIRYGNKQDMKDPEDVERFKAEVRAGKHGHFVKLDEDYDVPGAMKQQMEDERSMGITASWREKWLGFIK